MTNDFRVAAVQAAPVWLDREKSTDKACRLIQEAADRGAVLAAFGETWLPGYPVWAMSQGFMGRLRFADAYLEHAVEIPGPTTDRLCQAAAQGDIDVVIGVAERDRRTAGTAYSTLLFIGADGTILGRHRKLKPTDGERTIWGDGDASGLRVHERPYGRISGLNCWEHNMVLPGYVLMAEGTQIHVAAWPGEDAPPLRSTTRQLLLSQAFASQAACYVVCVGSVIDQDGVPEFARDMVPVRAGMSAIIDPFGEILAGPVEGETILVAAVSLGSIHVAKTACDVGGHSMRSDIFRLEVDRQARDVLVTQDRLSGA
ncbi:MAG: carbon-nitrogen hydrolase family protein [Acidimicrobiales bacterium]